MKKINQNTFQQRGVGQVGRGDLVRLLDRFGPESLEKLSHLLGFKSLEEDETLGVHGEQGDDLDKVVYPAVSAAPPVKQPGGEESDQDAAVVDDEVVGKTSQTVKGLPG